MSESVAASTEDTHLRRARREGMESVWHKCLWEIFGEIDRIKDYCRDGRSDGTEPQLPGLYRAADRLWRVAETEGIDFTDVEFQMFMNLRNDWK